MTITSVPLSEREKKLFKKLFVTRVCLGIVLSPLLFVFIRFGWNNPSFSHTESLITLGFIGFIFFIIIKWVIPGYRDSYKNIKAQHKLIISTFIVDCNKNLASRHISFSIVTEYRIINTNKTIFLDPDPAFSFINMYVGMPIRIHCLEHNKTDIIKIEKV